MLNIYLMKMHHFIAKDKMQIATYQTLNSFLHVCGGVITATESQ